MFWKSLFATKSLEMLQAEAQGENRLRRVLGPIGLTSLGVGAIIGSGIFVMTGEVAANAAGPGILLSFVVAGFCCALAALCYAEFASLAPVAGSAYTYAYATLGELFAWIIGWDLILEYAMSAATVAAAWSKYFNRLTKILFDVAIPEAWCNDPFSTHGAVANLPAVAILLVCTVVLVVGIRESVASNTALVLLKIGVVLFVIAIGIGYVQPGNWTSIPAWQRKTPEEFLFGKVAADVEEKHAGQEKQQGRALSEEQITERVKTLTSQTLAVHKMNIAHQHGTPEEIAAVEKKYSFHLPQSPEEKKTVETVLAQSRAEAPTEMRNKWGVLGLLGVNESITALDDHFRSPFLPYGLSGIMFGAALVFFAYLGFDSVSTHAEEAIRPQRDVPFGILASLVMCTILYMGVAAVITGMVPYPDIDTDAAVASAFATEAEKTASPLLKAASGLIAAGALAGMTSVLLITFLSQARIFLAMARDGLLPQNIFGSVHEKFRTPHISTMVTGGLMCLVAAFTPIRALEEMVNIGTFFAFVVVCAAVLILRIKRPDAPRPFRCPLVYIVAPLGIIVNLLLMLFLSLATWERLVIWLAIGMVIYFAFGFRHSVLRWRPPVPPWNQE